MVSIARRHLVLGKAGLDRRRCQSTTTPRDFCHAAESSGSGRDGGKLVPVCVAYGNDDATVTRIGVVSVSTKCGWDLLDSLVLRLFREYVMRVDPAANLGLAGDAVAAYTMGEVTRREPAACIVSNSSGDGSKPEFLPYGYLVGDVGDIRIRLRSPGDEGDTVDSLAWTVELSNAGLSLLLEKTDTAYVRCIVGEE